MNQSSIKPSASARFMLVAAAFVILVAGMKAAQPLLVPFLLALFIAVMATPPLFYLTSKGMPNWLALSIVMVGIILCGILLGWMIGGSLDDFKANLPKYQERLTEQSHGLFLWLQKYGFKLNEGALSNFVNPGKAMSLAGKLLSGLGNVLTQALFILITVTFILLEASVFQQKIRAFSSDPEASMARIREITTGIKQYMSIKTSTSLLTGVLVSSCLWFIGVDYPVLWGLIAFLFNYVPNIGSIIAAIPAILLALVQLGLWPALWTGLIYVLINALVGNVIEPRFMGKGLGLSPLIVFISLVFWGWILGPVGMFLSIPLTMTLKIALDSNEETRKFALLLE